MTDPLTYLQAAHKQAEQAAQATTPVPMAGEWAAVRDEHADEDTPLALIQGQDPDEPGYQGYGRGLPVIVLSAEWQDEAEANLRHIALHDPAAVLRRIHAERKLLAEHEPDGWNCSVCSEEDYDGVDDAFRRPLDSPCPTVRLLAEAWGWQEGEQR